jgi:holin-like protein
MSCGLSASPMEELLMKKTAVGLFHILPENQQQSFSKGTFNEKSKHSCKKVNEIYNNSNNVWNEKGAIFLKADKFVIYILQICGLILINKAGFYLVDFFNLLIPGNVLGMIILFLMLWLKIVKLEWIEGAADLLVRHLSFFFVSISVGLMTLGGLLAEAGIQIAVILVCSALIGMAISGGTSHFIVKNKERKEAQNAGHDI